MRKPLEGAVAENVLKYDTGALNLGGCRVRVAGEEEGRWAANLILEHLPDCSRGQGGSVEACVNEDEATGREGEDGWWESYIQDV